MADTDKKGILSEQEFESLVPQLMDKFTAKSLKVAKLIWVDGLTAYEAGKALGMSRQSASALGIRLERARASAPEGWVLINLYAPPELAKDVKTRVQALRDELSNKPN